ncbi:MAG: D-lyxose/D-mannose family sugar isomerase [Capsulimonadales bacterium]|nr:D-lyxose/D-mannose family sugar isomerase [Capsulimonadales bacterium]
MKRSEINQIMERAKDFLAERRFALPPFAYWSPEQWVANAHRVDTIVEQQLGWDITDFGSGDFARVGLFLFTMRNGTPADMDRPTGKVYAEKVLMVEPGQVTPTHFHYRKMEDIINRGGGVLEVRLWRSTAEDGVDPDTPVEVWMDGIPREVPAGGTILLEPGESVCLPQRLFHRFRGKPGAGTVLVGEVSRVNDDRIDNYFPEGAGRFPAIEEDAPPRHLLIPDYPLYRRTASP